MDLNINYDNYFPFSSFPLYFISIHNYLLLKKMYRWAISLAFLAFGVVNAQTACNGYAEYCSKPYNSLTHVLTHNSYGYIANPAANQLCPVTTQLADGVRGLKLSAINPSNTTTTTATSQSIYLCHTSCSILNAGPAVETLGNVTEWLKNNPNEVLTISWNNLGGFALDAFEAAYNASGILEYTYTQTTGNYTWPTIQEMINSGKRVVNFIDTGADQSTLPW
jgi:hypothetical protein